MTMPLTGSVNSYPRLVHPVSTLTVSPASEITSGSQVRRMNPSGSGFGGFGVDPEHAGRQRVGLPGDGGAAFPPVAISCLLLTVTSWLQIRGVRRRSCRRTSYRRDMKGQCPTRHPTAGQTDNP